MAGYATDWYLGDRAQTVITCPLCFAAVAATERSAAGHKDWHKQQGDDVGD